MKFPICPFCQKHIKYSVNNSYECEEFDDHSFCYIGDEDNSWYLHHYPSKLYIDNDSLCDESNVIGIHGYPVTLIEYNNITPEEGVIQLNRYLRLKAFL